MKLNIIKKNYFSCHNTVFAFTVNLHAQEDDIKFENDVNNEAPIDSLVYVRLIDGTVIGYRTLRKREIV